MRRSIHATYRFLRDPDRFEIVEVIIGGKRIEAVRIMQHGYTLDYSILAPMDSQQQKSEKQLDLFGGKS